MLNYNYLIAVFDILVLSCIFYSLIRVKPFLLVFSSFTLVYMGIRPFFLLNDLYIKYIYVNNSYTYPDYISLIYAIEFQFFAFVTFSVGYFLHNNLRHCKYKMFPENYSNTFVPFFISILVLIIQYFIGGLFIFSYAMFFIGVLYFILNRRRLFFFKASVGLFLLVLFIITLSDNRRDFLSIIYIIIIVYLIVSKSSMTLKKMIGGSLILCLMLLVMVYTAVALRTDGLFEYSSVVDRLSTSMPLVLGVLEVETDFSIVYDDYVLLFSGISDVGYLYGISFLKPLLAWLPRELLPNKPLNVSSLFAYHFNYSPYINGGSEPITIYGNLYWNIGWFSLFIFFLMGVFSSFMDKFLMQLKIRNKTLQVSTLVFIAATSFHIYRGPWDTFYLIHVFGLISLFLYIFIFNFMNIIRSKKRDN